MRNYIQHTLNDNPDEVLKYSIKDCHVTGMHSLMFDRSGRKIRMFYTGENHMLGNNFQDRYNESGLTVGFHPHHCNISLAPIVGEIQNWSAKQKEGGDINVNMYHFDSHINSGNGGFQLLQRQVELNTTKISTIMEGESIFMPAKEMHTVGVEPGEKVAWFVFEGKENMQHSEKCFSNADLTNWTPEGLYNPYAHIDEIKEDLFSLGIL